MSDNTKPGGQPVIDTYSVQEFRRCMLIAIKLRNDQDPKADDALIVVIYGRSGIGKTFAIWGFLQSHTGRTITDMPSALRIEVKQDVTKKGLAKQILQAFGEKPRGREFYDIADDVFDTIRANQPELLIFDEADRLNEETFEFLRSVTDATRVPIVLVGLPNILNIIDIHSKFENRIAMVAPFEALSEEEFLEIFLPQLVLPRWSFESTNDQDREIGQLLWDRLQPVLRRVRAVIRIASKIATIEKSSKISKQHILSAFKFAPKKPEGLGDNEDADNESQGDSRRGSHEKESELRRDAKERRGRR